MIKNTLTANGAGQWIDIGNQDNRTPISAGAVGTFGGGTATLEVSFEDDKSNPVAVQSGLTSDGVIVTNVRARWVRWSLAGSTSPNLNLYIAI